MDLQSIAMQSARASSRNHPHLLFIGPRRSTLRRFRLAFGPTNTEAAPTSLVIPPYLIVEPASARHSLRMMWGVFGRKKAVVGSYRRFHSFSFVAIGFDWWGKVFDESECDSNTLPVGDGDDDDDDDCTTRASCIVSTWFGSSRAAQWHPRYLLSLRFVLVAVANVILLLVMLPRRRRRRRRRRHGVTMTATAIHLYHVQR
jgi:hypothetical protein